MVYKIRRNKEKGPWFCIPREEILGARKIKLGGGGGGKGERTVFEESGVMLEEPLFHPLAWGFVAASIDHLI